MAQTDFNVGAIANDGTGEPLRQAFQEQQEMNTELYTTKVDKVVGKELSSNDYTDAEVVKLGGIEAGAEVNVQADCLEDDPTSDAYIKNFPTQLFSSVGYFHYTDTATQTTPLTILPDTNKKLTNDGLGAQTNLTQAPYGISTLFNTTTNEFDFSQLSIGDTLDLRVDLLLTTTSANQHYLVFLRVGEGSVAQYDLPILNGQIKSISSDNRIIGNEPFSIDYQEHIDNPATLYILSDDDGSVKVNGWFTSVIRKSVNIVAIPDDFIPLAGTITGKEVTGIIRVEGDNGNGIVSTFDDKTSGVNFNGTNSNFFAQDNISGDGTNLNVTPDGLYISSSTPTSKGISADTDFSPNITDLDYTQKIYVDKNIDKIIDTVGGSTLVAPSFASAYLKLIPANTYKAYDFMNLGVLVEKIGTTTTCSIKLGITTSASFPSPFLTNQIALYTLAANQLTARVKRTMTIGGGNIEGLAKNTSSLNDDVAFNVARSVLAFDPTIDNYLHVEVNSSDTIRVKDVYIR